MGRLSVINMETKKVYLGHYEFEHPKNILLSCLKANGFWRLTLEMQFEDSSYLD